ncbi:MAG: RpiB/LacA/LacB family sugar-phosphate isomerase [Candidatus Magasanikbacteria bacterium]|nr:RpiB/LacA/LacB family sugar-phosphate isomerase [Candidatus Magasanikbacteria bacterium]
MPQIIYLGADHAGFELKEKIKDFLKLNEYLPEDLTPGPIDPQDDYPDAAAKVAAKVLETGGLGILICGSGNGICMAANKIKGIRAALGYNTRAGKLAREHLNANILCLAGSVLQSDYAQAITRHFLETPFSEDERHKRRIEKLGS